VSVLLVCISTSALRLARRCLSGGGGAEGSERRGGAVIPGLLWTAAAKVSKKQENLYIAGEQGPKIQDPIVPSALFRIGLSHAGREGPLPPPILLPSPETIFTVPCSLLLKDKSMQNLHCLRWASLETFQVISIPSSTALLFPLRVPKLSPEGFASNTAK